MKKEEVEKMSQGYLPLLYALRFCLCEMLGVVPAFVLGDSAYSLGTRLLYRVDNAIEQIEKNR